MSRDPMKSFDDREFSNKTTQGATTNLNDVRDKVSDVASKVKDKAGQLAGTVSEKIGQGRDSAVETFDWAASNMHQKADSVPGGPKVANFTHGIAGGMESTASYLRDHDLGDMGKDVMNVCRRYPAQSLVAALAVGFLLGRSRR